ncbi:Nudix protein [Venustampulla echinocandica]|uniref:Nudix protein n=1 Tax=Venustampulla echinocandica TaxID=2656787 RepID=A0A370TTD4_9HELO|nr:Nudix protein [Venustampulla echinocandica]RDL38764.1 Nudix protein [Venustampulla echinocandica]
MANAVSQPKGYLDLINAVDNVSYDFDFNTLYRLLLPNDPRPHGFILPSTVSEMPWTSDFIIDNNSRTVQLRGVSEGKDTASACNAAFQNTINIAIDKGLPMIQAKHSEMYKIMGANSFMYLERFTAPLFGIATRGAHMTAYVRTTDGLKIWVPRRSAHLFSYPDMLDTTVAGGIKADHSPFECILAEADEEASLPAGFVRQNARAVGVVTYVTRKEKSGLIHPDVLYVFDIELPETMAPKPQDDEVSEFYLWSVEEVKQAMLRREFKPNCSLVMIDFFVRHGIITQENEDDYVEIVSRLRRKLPVPTRPER